MISQSSVVLQPPKRCPSKDDVTGPFLPEPFQFVNGNLIAFRWPPVSTPAFQKRNNAAIGEFAVISPLVVVDKDKGASHRNDLQNFGSRTLQLLGPMCCS